MMPRLACAFLLALLVAACPQSPPPPAKKAPAPPPQSVDLWPEKKPAAVKPPAASTPKPSAAAPARVQKKSKATKRTKVVKARPRAKAVSRGLPKWCARIPSWPPLSASYVESRAVARLKRPLKNYEKRQIAECLASK